MRRRLTGSLVFLRMLMLRLVPPLSWLPQYRWVHLKGDLLAGVSTGIMGIPQGMAYALIAGLPAIVGLYSSTVPAFVYSMFGTSKDLVFGPIAVVSLILERGINPQGGSDPADYTERVFCVTFMVGIIYIAMGFLQLGFIVNLFSKPVLSAFMSASAVIIVSEQAKYLLGVSFPRQEHFYETVYQLFKHMQDAQIYTMAGSVVSLIMLFACKKLKKFLPILEGPVILVALGTACAWVLDFETKSIALVGKIPSGFPAPRVPIPLPTIPSGQDINAVGAVFDFYFSYVLGLFPVSFTLVMVGYIASISIATKIGEQKKYAIDPSQELMAMGAANLVGSFFSSFTGAGSLSRTMVNAQAGANSQIASIFGAIIVMAVIFFFTPVFYYLPKFVLGSIVIMAVLPLVEYKDLISLWKIKRKEAALWISTVIATLLFGIINGILLSIFLSMALVIYRSSRPHTDILGRLPNSTTYRNVKRFPHALVIPRMFVLSFGATLYFANIGFLKQRLHQEELKNIVPFNQPQETIEESREKIAGVIVLDWSAVNDIDYTACMQFIDTVMNYKEKNILFLQAALQGRVRDTLQAAGLVGLIGEENFFWDVHDAVCHGQHLLEATYGQEMEMMPERVSGDDSDANEYPVPDDYEIEGQEKTEYSPRTFNTVGTAPHA